MIWNEKSTLIIMITKIKEAELLGNLVTKCFLYWPENELQEMIYEPLSIKNIGVIQIESFYIQTSLEIRHKNDSQVLKVDHIQCLCWADHLPPSQECGKMIETLIFRIKENIDKAKIVVHCRFFE